LNLKAHEKISRKFYATKTSADNKKCVGNFHKVENYFGNFSFATMRLVIWYIIFIKWAEIFVEALLIAPFHICKHRFKKTCEKKTF
jgi:hypothetical protein